MFRSSKIYIQIKRNQVTVVNLKTGEELTRTSPTSFSPGRSEVNDFAAASETILSVLRELGIRTTFTILKVVIHQLEGGVGGLNDVEKRALMDLAENIGANKVFLSEADRRLTIDEALALVEGRSA
jgi:hypothetical protein